MLTLTDSLTDLAGEFGADDPLVKKVLAGKSPVERAAELVTNPKLKDVAFRKKLYAGGRAAIEAANDPMINIALADRPGRAPGEESSRREDETKQQAYGEIARARFADRRHEHLSRCDVHAPPVIWDGRGYEENGKQIPAFTDFAGLYQRAAEHENKPPFDLPHALGRSKSQLSLAHPSISSATPTSSAAIAAARS